MYGVDQRCPIVSIRFLARLASARSRQSEIEKCPRCLECFLIKKFPLPPSSTIITKHKAHSICLNSTTILPQLRNHTHSAIMSDQNGTTVGGNENVNPSAAPKGKGKAIDTEPTPREVSMDEDDDSSDEETGAEEDVWMPMSTS